MGTAERREREKQKRKNEILDAAEEIFLVKGINNATMDEVAEKSELSKGTLYLYFKSKEELYFAITQRALIKLLELFREAVKGPEHGLKKVRAIGLAYFAYAKDYPKYFSLIANYEAAHLNKILDEAVLMQCHMLGRQAQMVIADAVREGIADGSIRVDVDPMQIAFLLQGQSTGLIQMIEREREHIEKLENFTPDQLFDTFFNFVFNALKAKE